METKNYLWSDPLKLRTALDTLGFQHVFPVGLVGGLLDVLVKGLDSQGTG